MNRFVSSSQVSKASRARLVSWRRRILAGTRISFGILWAVSAWFTCQPAAISALHTSLALAVRNDSLVAMPWVAFWLRTALADPATFAWGIALVEGCVALGLLCGVFTNLTCSMGIALSMLGWSTRGLGLVAPLGLSTLAGDPGIALVCILTCAGLSLSGAGQFAGLDQVLSPKLGRWSFLASGRARQTVPPEQAVAWQHVGYANKRPLHPSTLSSDSSLYGRSRHQPATREQVLSARKRP